MLVRFVYSFQLLYIADILHVCQWFSVTGLQHDVLLLHADTEAMNKLGASLHRRLTERSKPPYEVYHYNREVPFGQST